MLLFETQRLCVFI